MKKLFGGSGAGGGAKLTPQNQASSSFSNSGAVPSSSYQLNDRDYRGQAINVAGMTVVIESKLAEGGFSIVFLVKYHHQNSIRYYALKRQFVNEPTLLEACRREIEITRTLGTHHPNIVTYITSSLTPLTNSDGNVHEYLLLTQYYRGSVLRLMNERLSVGQWLSADEVIRIFSDVCAAVARLHHCQTPVIHRDLKVENLLLDEDGRCVLCDFGSATTRTLSTKTHSRTLVEDEVARFTTLSYRAPEMIDLYAGQPITTKVDIWALGVMLYKLCYFALPFGESSLGIQNSAFSFPVEPTHFPQELLGLIVYMLTPEIERRPDIYQVSCVAYRLRNRACPVKNLNNVAVPDASFLLTLLREHGARKTYGLPSIGGATIERGTRTPNNENAPSSQLVIATPATTSVAPRQRPKPSRRGMSPAGTPTVDNLITPVNTPPAAVASVPAHVVQRLIDQSPSTLGGPPVVAAPTVMTASATASFMARSDAVSTASDTPNVNEMVKAQQQPYQQHRRNASDPSAALLDATHLSAFKPYKSQQHVPTDAAAAGDLAASSTTWNPFDLDDHSFGLSFDALPRPRKDSNASTVNVKSRESLIIDAPSTTAPLAPGHHRGSNDLDPFGAAPFRPAPPPKPAHLLGGASGQKKKIQPPDVVEIETKITSAIPVSAAPSKAKKGYEKLIEDAGALRVPLVPLRARRRSGNGDSDSVGSASDLQARMQASGSSTGDEDDFGATGKTRGRRGRRDASSEEDEEGDEENEENDFSTDEDDDQRHRRKRDRDEDVVNASSVGGSSKATLTAAGNADDTLTAGVIEGGFFEQELIGRQPLLADDDEEDAHLQQTQNHHQQASIFGVRNAQNSMAENFELTVLRGPAVAGGDVFRNAPFLASNSSSVAHGGMKSGFHQRPLASVGPASAFVNTTFQEDDALRLE